VIIGDGKRERGARPVLLLRADASTELGSGHVMRLVALADAHQRRGGRSVFALNRAAEPLVGLLAARGHGVATIAADSGTGDDADAVLSLARTHAAAAVVIDGDFAGPAYEADLALRGGAKVIAVDDGAGRTTAAHILVNPNAGAELDGYHGDPASRILCGPRYALLRREFLAQRHLRQRAPGPPSLLVTFGGSDPEGGTARALRCLPPAPQRRVLVVLGAHHAADQALEAAEQAARRGHAVEVLHSPPDMAAVMHGADAAISAAGGTLLELACLGCPSLAFVVADNQERGYRALVAAECVAGGGDLRRLDDQELAAHISAFLDDGARQRRRADRARKLVDGLGATRVLSALREHPSGPVARAEATA
jgi:UDP-2,4-diacetamido-2,4,6-trideoxy-beta-L-altropyranose hydrolase